VWSARTLNFTPGNAAFKALRIILWVSTWLMYFMISAPSASLT
jgi:hypothetical protein